MEDSTIKIDNKIQEQVDHIFNIHNIDMLKYKVRELAFEWYIKGFKAAGESIKTNLIGK